MIRLEVATDTGIDLIEKLARLAPGATVIVGGTLVKSLLSVKVTTAPPSGAEAFNSTIAVVRSPPIARRLCSTRLPSKGTTIRLF